MEANALDSRFSHLLHRGSRLQGEEDDAGFPFAGPAKERPAKEGRNLPENAMRPIFTVNIDRTPETGHGAGGW